MCQPIDFSDYTSRYYPTVTIGGIIIDAATVTDIILNTTNIDLAIVISFSRTQQPGIRSEIKIAFPFQNI